MKYLSSILLVIFMVFQLSTSISYLVESCNESSINIIDQDEDEESSEKSEKTSNCKAEFILFKIFNSKVKSFQKFVKISNFYLIANYCITIITTIIPPEQV